MRDPRELETEHTLRFLRQVLPAPGARILEVGCGDGALAVRLMEDGYDVTGVEPDADSAARARQRGVRILEAGVLEASGGPFDVVAFTLSLHHVGPLDPAMDHVHGLLAPGGRLVCEEFDLYAMDEPTAEWFYRRFDELVPEPSQQHPHDPHHPHDRPEGGTPLQRWLAAHEHDPPLAGGDEMLQAARRRFEVGGVQRVAYLYGYVCDALPPGEDSFAVAARLYEEEEGMLRQGSLKPVGLRWTGVKKQN